MASQLKCYGKIFNVRSFLIALIVISFSAGLVAGMQNPAPGEGQNRAGRPDSEDPCRYEVTGCVTYVAYRTIVLDGVTILKTPLHWTLPQVDDRVSITYWVNPDGEKVACSMTIIGTCL